MARATHTELTLRAGPLAAADLTVRRVTGREALSSPFSFEIDFHRLDGESVALEDLRGAKALVTLRRHDGPERHLNGILWSVAMLEVVDGKPRYRATLAPKLLRLAHVRRSRVFQKQSVPDVVAKVLEEGGVEHKLSLSGSHAPREYCVQYRESDLAFVSRLLEDEGIFYFFDHTESAHTMVLTDSASGCVDLGDAAVFRFPRQYRKLGAAIEKAARKYDLPEAFVCAVIARETGGVNQVGDHGHAVGVMQIDTRFHREWLSQHDGMDPESNIDYGCSLLRRNLDAARDLGLSGRAALQYAAARYNASEESVLLGFAHADLDRYTTGLDYGRDVLRRMREFERASADAPDDEHLFHLDLVQRVRAGKVALKDFDFTRPALAVAGSSTASGDKLALEHYEFPGGFVDPGQGTPIAKRRLEELRFASETFEGDSSLLRFSPGSVVDVKDHPVAGFNRKLLLVRVDHEAHQQERADAPEGSERGYSNNFLALDAKAPYRPRRRTPWPTACAETAEVVGPSGEEIYPNAHDSVKVQFHWDREGKKNETSSCFVRVAQVWAGPGWGGSFLPRIGQEVLVRFLDGDPDRPVVLGAIYNGRNPPPVALPGDKTKSTLRTASSPGSSGDNELRFEDAKGDEQIWLHGQKDENLRVLHDKTQAVRANEELVVRNDRGRDVKGAQKLGVGKDDQATVHQNQTLKVQRDRHTTVDGGHTEEIDARQAVTIGARQAIRTGTTAMLQAGAAATLTVGGALSVKVSEGLAIAVSGSSTGKIGGNHDVKVSKEGSETLAASGTRKIGGDSTTKVDGDAAFSSGADWKDEVGAKAAFRIDGAFGAAGKSLRLQGDKLSVAVGSSKLAIDSSGNVSLEATKLTLEGSDLTLKGSEVKKSG